MMPFDVNLSKFSSYLYIISPSLGSIIEQFLSSPFERVKQTYSVEMTSFGSFIANILMALMFVVMFCITNIVAQDSGIAPTGQLEAGAGFSLPVSKVVLCSSVLASLMAFMLK